MAEAPLEENDVDPKTPRWVKLQGFFVLLLIVVVVGMSSGLINLRLLGFQHGPGGHGLGGHALSDRGRS